MAGGKPREEVQRPLVPIFAEATKGLFECCTKATLDLLNALTNPGFSRYSFISHLPTALCYRKRNCRHITLPTERFTLLMGLAVAQREFRPFEGTIHGG